MLATGPAFVKEVGLFSIRDLCEKFGMAELVLVRHGQASAFEADYDKLSEVGHRQARALGDHWVKTGVRPDAIVVGGLRRHRETEAGVREAFDAAGLALPPAEEDSGWDEYDAYAVVGKLGPVLAERDAVYRELQAQAQAAFDGPHRNRYFQRAFEALMTAWVEGSVEAEGVEAFAHFHGRVEAARERILKRAGGGQIAVFTSGGPIGVNVQLTMEAPPMQALAINSRVRNGSLTHFLFSKGRVSFDRFNLVHHLEHDPELLTFR